MSNEEFNKLSREILSEKYPIKKREKTPEERELEVIAHKMAMLSAKEGSHELDNNYDTAYEALHNYELEYLREMTALEIYKMIKEEEK